MSGGRRVDTNQKWDCPGCDAVNEPGSPVCECGFEFDPQNLESEDEKLIAVMHMHKGSRLILIGIIVTCLGIGLLTFLAVARIRGDVWVFVGLTIVSGVSTLGTGIGVRSKGKK
jgi:hypothetical protein